MLEVYVRAAVETRNAILFMLIDQDRVDRKQAVRKLRVLRVLRVNPAKIRTRKHRVKVASSVLHTDIFVRQKWRHGKLA